MKIVYIGAGAAGRYCGTCLHDNGLAAALQHAGHDALLVPIFTPIRTDEDNVSLARVFFGGINVFLQQKSFLFRHTPWFLDKLLDSPRLLDWLSRRSSGMEARQLGELTVSTLQGEHGKQKKELEKLVRWLESDIRPDIVHLSNSMLAGMAHVLRRRLGVPVVCSLMGEDIFLEQLPEPHYSQARQLLREKALDIDHFVALNRYFAQFMADYLATPAEKIAVIPHGLNLSGHGTRRQRNDGQYVIGYFARIAAEKGLHNLIEAVGRLVQATPTAPIRLRVAGYMSEADQPYFEMIQEQVAALGLSERVDFAGELDRPGKIAFLQSVDVQCIPTVYHESKGISALEALASAVPLIVPAHGMFPELIDASGGGWVHSPDDPAALVEALRTAWENPAETAARGQRGQAFIRQEHTAQKMAERTVDLYQRLLISHAKR